MSGYHGDVRLGDTIDLKFSTVSTAGVPTTLAGTPVISAYVGNSTTQITAGITLSVDFDGVTGLHNVRVVASAGNGYGINTNISLVITTGTVGGSSVVGYEIGSFSIENRSALVLSVANSARRKPELGIADQGIASAAFTLGPPSTITLQTGHGYSNNTANGKTIVYWGTTAGTEPQVGVVASSSGDVFTLETQPTETPTGTINYVMFDTPAANFAAVIAANPTIASLAAAFVSSGVFSSGAMVNSPAGTQYDLVHSGTASAGSPNTLTSVDLTLAQGRYIDMVVEITAGTGANQRRKIIAHDASASPPNITFESLKGSASVANTNTFKILKSPNDVLAATTHEGATVPTVTNVGTLTTYTGNTPQSGDSYPKTAQLVFANSLLSIGVVRVNGVVVAGSGTTLDPWHGV